MHLYFDRDKLFYRERYATGKSNLNDIGWEDKALNIKKTNFY